MNWKAACRSVALTITATALLASCSDQEILGGDWHGVARIDLSPARIQLNDGDRAPVTVRALNAEGDQVAVSANDSRFQFAWESSDASVAQIEGSGASVHIRAVGPGSARVAVSIRPRSSGSSDTQLTTSTEVLTFAVAAAARAQAGDNQVGIVGQLLPENLAVSVLDRQNRPVSGVSVTFATTDGGAFEPATATTDASGVARTSWRLGTRQGGQTATASTPTGTSMQFRASASPAAPESVQPVSDATQTGTVGQPLPNRLQARITDRFGNGIGGLPATWQVVSGGGSLIAATAMTDSSGVAEATWVLGSTAGVQSAHAQIAGMTTVFSAVAQAAEPSRIIRISGDGQSGAVNSRLANPLVVRVLDTHGNAIAGASVSWQVTSGGGSVDPATSTSDATGNARTTWTLGSIAGQGTVSATLGTSETTFTGTATSSSPPPPPPSNPPPSNPPPTPSAPGRVTDLHVVSSTSNSITLRWTAVSDGNGASAAYALRAATPTLEWGAAYASERSIAAGTTGQPVTYTFTGLTAGTSYQFQLVSYRGTLNVDAVFGERSNIVGAATAAAPAPVVASITVTPSAHTFTQIGQTQQLVATARDASGASLNGIRFIWSSSNPSIVSVDSMGRMTARAAGSALVVVCAAAACDAADTTSAIVEPPPNSPAVASIAATPATHQFTAVGQTQQITVTARDASGATISNPALSWTTSNASVISINNTGRMTAMGAGTARVIVTAGGIADTVNATVTVSSPPPVGGGDATYPNRPSGTTLIGRMDGSVKESGGHAFGIADFGNWYDHNVASDIAVVNDPTNPTGSGRSLRFTYPSNDSKAGSASARTFSGGPYRELYVMVRVFMEPSGWETFGNKFFYIGAGGRTSGGPNQYYTDRPGGQHLRVINQYSGSPVVVSSANSGIPNPLTWGTWLNIEYRFVAESSPGAGNGQMYVWINNRLVGSNNAVAWSSSGFDGMEWYAEVNNIPVTSYYRLGELYIAGRN